MARVLVVAYGELPSPRRHAVQLRHVARALASLHAVDVLVIRGEHQPHLERQGAVRMLRVPLAAGDGATQLASFQRALRRQLEGDEYDVIHCCDPFSFHAVSNTGTQAPIVYDVARLVRMLPTAVNGIGTFAALHVEALQRAGHVIVPTEEDADACRQYNANISVSAHGVDIDRFDWDHAPPNSEAPRILAVGDPDVDVGFDVLLEAMATVVQRFGGRNAPVLHVVGGMKENTRATMHAVAIALNIEANVVISPAVAHEQMPALIAGMALCVVPGAARENPHAGVVPTRVLEFWACRRPVVAAATAVPPWVCAQRLVREVRDGDAAALAKGIVDLLDNDRARDQISRAGYRHVRDAHPASATRRSIRDTYAMLARRYSRLELAVDANEGEGASYRMASEIGDEADLTMYEEGVAATGGGESDLVIGVVQSGEIVTASGTLPPKPHDAGGTVRSPRGSARSISAAIDSDGLGFDPNRTAQNDETDSERLAGEVREDGALVRAGSVRPRTSSANTRSKRVDDTAFDERNPHHQSSSSSNRVLLAPDAPRKTDVVVAARPFSEEEVQLHEDSANLRMQMAELALAEPSDARAELALLRPWGAPILWAEDAAAEGESADPPSDE